MSGLLCEELEHKTSVVCFCRDGVSQQTRERFEDAFALGRMFHESYSAFVTTSHGDKSVPELVKLCSEEFASPSNPFFPHFLIVLDERTGHDGSACLVRKINEQTTHTLRVYAYTISSLMGVASIEHTTLEDIILNNCPEDEPNPADAFIYGDAAPSTRNRFGTTHRNVRVPLDSFSRGDGPSAGFTTLQMDAKQVEALGFPPVAVKSVWFGAPPDTILLQAVSTRGVPDMHVTGEVME